MATPRPAVADRRRSAMTMVLDRSPIVTVGARRLLGILAQVVAQLHPSRALGGTGAAVIATAECLTLRRWRPLTGDTSPSFGRNTPQPSFSFRPNADIQD
jgi:hypothetical protein